MAASGYIGMEAGGQPRVGSGYMPGESCDDRSMFVEKRVVLHAIGMQPLQPRNLERSVISQKDFRSARKEPVSIEWSLQKRE